MNPCSSDTYPRLRPEAAPSWLVPVLRATRDADAASMSVHDLPPPETVGRRAAVLVLFGETEAGPDLLLQERAASLRDHAGQVSFPGGATEQTDRDPVHTALREAAEETGLRPEGVVPLVVLPELYIPPSGFCVTPVLAHWPDPVAVSPVDPGETARVVRVPVAELADPANRFLIRHSSGFVSPAFEVAGMVVWGFTGGLVDALLRMGGWERPWTGAELDLDSALASARRRHSVAGPDA
ncbi:NUDIX hydrolase [Pseudonocardia spinosispora]|uniref:NUDIX hydrolase n=1 Tax=Pseudonocardia spinosispora TaxID=103441 RepID=UPI0003FD8183|nr:CoA pyrophosphatase [Pseudonocardia spinosispora]